MNNKQRLERIEQGCLGIHSGVERLGLKKQGVKNLGGEKEKK